MTSKRSSHKGLLEEVESFMAEHGIFGDDASSQVVMHIERFSQGGTSLLYLVVSSSAPKHVTYTRLLSAASSHYSCLERVRKPYLKGFLFNADIDKVVVFGWPYFMSNKIRSCRRTTVSEPSIRVL